MGLSRLVKGLLCIFLGILIGVVVGLFSNMGEQKETSLMYTLVTEKGMTTRSKLDIPIFVGSYRINLNKGLPLSKQEVTEVNTYTQEKNRYEGVYTLTEIKDSGVYLIPTTWSNGGLKKLTLTKNASDELERVHKQLYDLMLKGSVWVVAECLYEDDIMVGVHYEWKGGDTLGNVYIYNKE